MSKYFTQGYLIDTKKADLVAESETITNFANYKFSVYRTKKTKRFFKVEEANYKDADSQSFVSIMTDQDAREYVEANFPNYEVNWKKFFEIEEY